jgi:hypothetical protein
MPQLPLRPPSPADVTRKDHLHTKVVITLFFPVANQADDDSLSSRGVTGLMDFRTALSQVLISCALRGSICFFVLHRLTGVLVLCPVTCREVGEVRRV